LPNLVQWIIIKLFRNFLRTYDNIFATQNVTQYTIPFDFKLTYAHILRTIQSHPVVSFLSINQWHNLLLAGGFITNSIIYYDSPTDLDFFIYGLSEADANNKLDSLIAALNQILQHIWITRSKNSVTITGQLRNDEPFHNVKIQFILRLYRTPAEILHGFDIDCCGAGYDGTNVWLTERAVGALKDMVNIVDFDRMSPSYEARLAKYMARGFSVYVPELNLERINIVPIDEPWKLTGLSKLIYYHYKTISENPNLREVKNFIDPSDYEVSTLYGRAKQDPNVENKNILIYSADPNGNWENRNQRILNWANGIVFAFLKDDKVIQIEYIPGNRFLDVWKDASVLPLPEGLTFASNGDPFAMPAMVQWKRINPGEQATGTFHKTVLNDTKLWYHGPLYN
jgi:hypothetical protein